MNYLCDKIVEMQSILNEKSADNERLANDLYHKKEYAASINRAYYACIQQMLWLLLQDFASETNFKSHCDAHNPNKLGIHELYIDLIKKELSKTDKLEASEFFDTINKLKKLRRQADYENHIMKFEQSDDAIGYCETVLAILEILN